MSKGHRLLDLALLLLLFIEVQLIGFPDSSIGKESSHNAEDLGSIPVLGRSPEEGKGYPFQYSGLENSMNCIVHQIAKSRTQMNDFRFTSRQVCCF